MAEPAKQPEMPPPNPTAQILKVEENKDIATMLEGQALARALAEWTLLWQKQFDQAPLQASITAIGQTITDPTRAASYARTAASLKYLLFEKQFIKGFATAPPPKG